MTALALNPFVTYTDTGGLPLAGGKIYTYAAGTTTPQATYTDATAVTPAANPIILDAAGRVPYGAIWGNGSYKLRLTTSADVDIYTIDNVQASGAIPDGTTIATPTAGDNSTKIANTAFTQNAINIFSNGFINKFRNPGCLVNQRGSGTVGAGTTAYTIDGHQISATGAGIAWAQGLQINRSHNCLQLTGQAGVTNGKWRQRIESYDAAPLAGQRITCQAFINNSALGVTLAPTLTVNYANASDNFGAVTNIAAANAVAMQTIANTATGIVAYTFDVPNLGGASGAANGLEFIIDFGNSLNGAARVMFISDFDVRATPGVPSGLNNNPPIPEIRSIGVEFPLNQRHFYSTFGNGVAPVQNVGSNAPLIGIGAVLNQNFAANLKFPIQMRTAPTVTTYSPNAASANWSTNGTTPTVSVQVTTSEGLGIIGTTSVTAGNLYSIHVTATAEL